MKSLLLIFTFFVAHLCSAEVSTQHTVPSKDEFKIIIEHLDKGDQVSSYKALFGNSKRQSNPAHYKRLLLLKSTAGSHHGATRVIDKGKFIILEGAAWITLDDKTLIDGRGDKASVIKIHKKSQVIVYLRGDFEVSTLLN